jgi:hypothetical protein
VASCLPCFFVDSLEKLGLMSGLLCNCWCDVVILILLYALLPFLVVCGGYLGLHFKLLDLLVVFSRHRARSIALKSCVILISRRLSRLFILRCIDGRHNDNSFCYWRGNYVRYI